MSTETQVALEDVPEPQRSRLREAFAQPLRGTDSGHGWELKRIIISSTTVPGVYTAHMSNAATGQSRQIVVSADMHGWNVTTYNRKNVLGNYAVPVREIRADVLAALPDDVQAKVWTEGDGGLVVVEVSGRREPDSALASMLEDVADAYNYTHHDGHFFYLVVVRFETRTLEQIETQERGAEMTARWFAMMEEDG